MLLEGLVMNNDLKQIKEDLSGEITDGIKQMLVLTWVNANAARRQDILDELETVAEKQNINLIREVIKTISLIAEAEEARNLVTPEYYKKHSLKIHGSRWEGLFNRENQ